MTTVSLTLSQVFEFALKAYQAGKLSEAEQLCLKILSADPDSAPTPSISWPSSIALSAGTMPPFPITIARCR
jgi:hypothetical protein